MKKKLDDIVFHLNELTKDEIKELKSYYVGFNRECGLCNECELKLHIIEIYELHKYQHKSNRRHTELNKEAEKFIVENYERGYN